MNISFHTGVSGLSSYQEGMNMIANNVANVNTFGYKPVKPSFKDLLYTNMDTNGDKKLPVGHGIQLAGANLSFKQGNMMQTGNEFDFAIAGNGFFAVDDKGATKYTRNGAMGISVQDDVNYLCSLDGSYILDGEGEKIEIPMKSVKDAKGDSTGTEIDFTMLQEKIGIYAFTNPNGLSPADGGRFMPTNVSGKAEALSAENRGSADILAYTLESSAVDMADEMAAMMQTQKAYQFSAKIVQTADQIEEIVNNLR
ncbi:MAG: flagellar hook-basal body protein [Oscillospiraceae bacterium]